jgi:alpha-tubulin suppressor-like RCC1 family protein
MNRRRSLSSFAALVVAVGLAFTVVSATSALAATVRSVHHSEGIRTSGAHAVFIAAGHADGCELDHAGVARCWGWNIYGEDGIGTTRQTTVPVVVHGLAPARQIAIGFAHTCALLRTSTVKCWGWNRYGQLGDARTTNTRLPVSVRALSGVRSIALGFEHSCALLASGLVRCWGWNYYGQLGTGTYRDAHAPTTVRGLSGVIQITAGYGHNCALLRAGTVKCWGWNKFGQLGNGTTRSEATPVMVAGLGGATSLAAGFGSTCAVLRSGAVKCWGRNQYGQLGNGAHRDEHVPVMVRGLSGATQTALGYGHTCALLRTRTVKCWGWNLDGQLGTGTLRNSSVPIGTRLTGVIQLVAGDDSACALLALGMISCWGSNNKGQLGDGSTVTRPLPPFTPLAPTNVTAVARAGSAVIRWHAPPSDGLGSIRHYNVTSHPGKLVCATSAHVCVARTLTNGVSYRFTVTAINVLGPGLVSSPSAAVTPATLPERPTSVTAIRGNRSAQVLWHAPASDGGGRIQRYRAIATDLTTPAHGGESCTWTSGPLQCAVLGLTNGNSYTFTVSATNVVGPSPVSVPSSAVVPADVPGQPTSVLATRGNGLSVVSWGAPGTNGGSAITSYKVTATDLTTPANGNETCTWTTGPLTCTVNGLTNGDSYAFGVTASNGAGTGIPSVSSVVVPATLPGSPTGVSATRGNASAVVTWSAPASNGGSAVTHYTVTATDLTTPVNGNETCTWTTGPLACTVLLLTNGDSYTFKATATNSVGAGPASTASTAVVPAGVPGKPTAVSATAGNGSAVVSWTAPASNGSSIIGYTVTAADSTTAGNGGETCSWTTGPLTCTVSLLTNGDSYTFTVTATNGAGTGAASLPSAAAVPGTTPGAPTGVSATAGNGSALVSWSAPASNGGSAITGYTVTAADSTSPGNGGETCSWTTGPLTCTVSGLTNGDSYRFSVTAKNSAGTGNPSSPSSAVVPSTTPGAPTGVSAAPGDASALVSWSAPGSNGGRTITAYTVTAADSTTPGNGGETCPWSSGPLSCTVSGLTNGDSYTFTVTATNSDGTGNASSSSSAVVPATVPGPPTGVSATPGVTSAVVTWSAPTSDGGSAITDYTVTAADSTTAGNGGETCTWNSGPLTCTVSALTTGDSYTFSVTATNSVGTSSPSSPSSPIIALIVHTLSGTSYGLSGPVGIVSDGRAVWVTNRADSSASGLVGVIRALIQARSVGS